MDGEKRTGETPIPDYAKSYLNEDQQAQLMTIEKFGWSLKYIRRPLFQDPVVIVMNGEGNSIGILEDDGRLNLDSDLQTRN